MMRYIILFLLLASVLGSETSSSESPSSRLTPVKRKRDLADLPSDMIRNIMTFAPQAQGALSTASKQLKITSDENSPYQTILARNLKLPELANVPVHVDLEVLDGVIVPDTREGKFAALRFLKETIAYTIQRSPIFGHLRNIYYDGLANLKPGLSVKEWIALDYVTEEKTISFTYYQMVDELAKMDKIETLHQILSNSLVKMPSILESSNFTWFNLDIKTVAIKTVEFLRDKPSQFRLLARTITCMSLPVLLACDYQPRDLVAILNNGDEIRKTTEFLNTIKYFLIRDYSHLASDLIFFKQLRVIMFVLKKMHEQSPEEIRSKTNSTEQAILLRFNQPVDASALSVFDRSTTALILIRAKKYEEALALIPDKADDSDVNFFIIDPEFNRFLAQKKGQTWIRSFFGPYRHKIWSDRSLIAGYYGIKSVETEFSTVMDKTLGKKVPLMWREMLLTLLEVGSKEDIKKFPFSAKGVPKDLIWTGPFEHFDSLGPKRFKFCVLTALEVSHQHESTVYLSFEAAKAVIEDAELFNALVEVRNSTNIRIDGDGFRKALNDNRSFEFMKAHMQKLDQITRDIYNIRFSCASPLEIARAYKLVGNGMPMEQFLVGPMKALLDNFLSRFSRSKKIIHSITLLSLFSYQRKISGRRTFEGVPEDMEELARKVHEVLERKDVLWIAPFLNESHKRDYYTLILLKRDYFNNYAE